MKTPSNYPPGVTGNEPEITGEPYEPEPTPTGGCEYCPTDANGSPCGPCGVCKDLPPAPAG